MAHGGNGRGKVVGEESGAMELGAAAWGPTGKRIGENQELISSAMELARHVPLVFFYLFVSWVNGETNC